MSEHRRGRRAKRWIVVALFAHLVACEQSPTTLKDTEGRTFSLRCQDGGCTVTQTSGPEGRGKPRLHATGHVLSVCDDLGTPPAPEACRPLICAVNDDCPVPLGEPSEVTCSRGLCVNSSQELRTSDSVTLCLAGTGLGRRTAEQAERYALGLNCGQPCVVPSACQQP